MKLYELARLPIMQRFKFVKEIKEDDIELFSDIKLVSDIFKETIFWFKEEERESLIKILNEGKNKLPTTFETIYEIKEKFKIEKLPNNEQLRIFNESKAGWNELYPDFKRITTVMECFNTNDMLIEFGKHSPPKFIHNEAIEIYKKSISYKVKFTKKIMSHLIQNPNTLHIHYYNGRIYCIKEDIIKTFLKDYQEWNLKMCNLWNTIYALKNKFYSFYAYEDWKWYIKHNDLLSDKADKIQKIQDDAFYLLNMGKELVHKHDEAITTEYVTNSFEMSLYEREKEIALLHDSDDASDEKYCYVYTLECELFVFYVGIAANPRERFEQHIRGAFSNEAHLFKSKFIQKYQSQVTQKVIYEGTRRECKKFERDYIFKFRPLGNMAEGG